MEQPQKTNIDATNEIDAVNETVELDDNAMEQATGGGLSLSSFHLPGIYQHVGYRYEGSAPDRKAYPVYRNRLSGNEHIQYPNGVRRYTS
jgi:hypothetical protein